MKILFVVLAVVALLWLLRNARRRVAPPPSAKPPVASAEAPQQMLACVHCGVHLPRGEALPGRGGVFCGEAHRTAYEKAHSES